MESIKRRVLIAGATGYLGGYVARALHDAGHFVRVLARDANRLKGIAGEFDDIFEGEATNSASLQGICDDMDVVFSSLGVRHMRRAPTIWDVDWKANLNVLEAARHAGVKHVIFVSVFRGAEIRATVPVAEARERVVDALMSGGPRFTVLRPTGFFNDMQEFLKMAKSGRVWLLGSGVSRINPVHGADIATHVVDAVAEGPRDGGRFLDIGGPDVFTMQEVGALAFEVLGTRPRYGSIPVGLMDFFGNVASPFNTNAAAFIKMLASFARSDAVAPLSGTHHLRTFFEEQAQEH